MVKKNCRKDGVNSPCCPSLVRTYVFNHVSNDHPWCDAVHTNLVRGPLSSEAPCELVHPSCAPSNNKNQQHTTKTIVRTIYYSCPQLLRFGKPK